MSKMAALPTLFNKCRTQAYPNPDAPPVTTANTISWARKPYTFLKCFHQETLGEEL